MMPESILRNEELVAKVVARHKRGDSYVQIAKEFGVSDSTVSRMCSPERAAAAYRNNHKKPLKTWGIRKDHQRYCRCGDGVVWNGVAGVVCASCSRKRKPC